MPDATNLPEKAEAEPASEREAAYQEGYDAGRSDTDDDVERSRAFYNLAYGRRVLERLAVDDSVEKVLLAAEGAMCRLLERIAR